MNKKDKKWLADLIDTAKICTTERKPYSDYDKLLFQLELKLKELCK